MINIQNKKSLENIFAHEFGSPYFPILAELYMNENDLRRAKQVCKIGLGHDMNNDCGKVMLAKIALIEEKPTVAEKWLKQAVFDNPINFVALRMLIRIEFILNRNSQTIIKYVNEILNFLPNDTEANNWLKDVHFINSKNTKKTKILLVAEKQKNIVEKKKNIKQYEIKSSMATFTMLQVLKRQKSYQQAILVLNMLEEKGIDPKRLNKERKVIDALIQSNRKS